MESSILSGLKAKYGETSQESAPSSILDGLKAKYKPASETQSAMGMPSVSVPKEAVGGYDAPYKFSQAFERLKADAKAAGHDIPISSGKRTIAEQQRLYDLYKAGKGNLAAKPNENAPHVRGVAVDVGLKRMTPAAKKWLNENAAKYGLGFPVKGEPWHLQLNESQPIPSFLQPTDTLKQPKKKAPGTFSTIVEGALKEKRQGDAEIAKQAQYRRNQAREAYSKGDWKTAKKLDPQGFYPIPEKDQEREFATEGGKILPGRGIELEGQGDAYRKVFRGAQKTVGGIATALAPASVAGMTKAQKEKVAIGAGQLAQIADDVEGNLLNLVLSGVAAPVLKGLGKGIKWYRKLFNTDELKNGISLSLKEGFPPADVVKTLVKGGATEDEAIQAVGAAIRTNEPGIAETVGKTTAKTAPTNEVERMVYVGEATQEAADMLAAAKQKFGVSSVDEVNTNYINSIYDAVAAKYGISSEEIANKAFNRVRSLEANNAGDLLDEYAARGKGAFEDVIRAANEKSAQKRTAEYDALFKQLADQGYTPEQAAAILEAEGIRKGATPKPTNEPGVAELAGKGRVTPEAVPTPLPVDDVRPVQIDSNVAGNIGEQMAQSSARNNRPWEKVAINVRTKLSERGVKGDRLEDAIDLGEEIYANGGKIDANDGYVTLYHRTTRENAEQIVKSQSMVSKEDRLFFGSSPFGQIEGYGDAVVKVRIPLEKLEISDVFADEIHVAMPSGKIGTRNRVVAELFEPPSPTTSRYGANYGTPVQATGKRPGYAMERPAVDDVRVNVGKADADDPFRYRGWKALSHSQADAPDRYIAIRIGIGKNQDQPAIKIIDRVGGRGGRFNVFDDAEAEAALEVLNAATSKGVNPDYLIEQWKRGASWNMQMIDDALELGSKQTPLEAMGATASKELPSVDVGKVASRKVNSNAEIGAKPGTQTGAETGRLGQNVSPDLGEIKQANAPEPPPVKPVEPKTVAKADSEDVSGFARVFGDEAESQGATIDDLARKGQELSDTGKVSPASVYQKVAKNEALTGEDISVGIYRQRQVRNRSKAIQSQLSDPNLDIGTRAALEAEMDGLIDEASLIHDTLKAARKTFHQAGQALQIGLKEDFSLSEIIAKARAANRGAPLGEVEGKLRGFVERMDVLEKELEDIRKLALDRAKKSKPIPLKDKEAVIRSIRGYLGLGKEAPVGSMGSKQSGAISIPVSEQARVTRQVNALIKTYIEDGANTIDDVVARLKSDIGGIDDDDALSLISGSYKTKLLAIDVEKKKIADTLRKVKRDAAIREMPILNRVIYEGTDAVISLQRQLQAGLDASFAFIQGLPALLTHPKSWAGAWKQAAKTVKGGKSAAQMVSAELERRPMYANARKAGVAFSDMDGTLAYQEENLAGHILEKMRDGKIPVLKTYAEALSRSNEGYAAFLNDVRQMMFEGLVQGRSDDADLMRDMARLVNITTGRGDGKMAQALSGKHFAVMLYAPRYMLSTFQNAFLPLLLPSFKTAAGKKAAMKTWGKQVGVLMGVYEMAKLTLGEENVDTDIRSANFGQITLPSGQTINPIKKISAPVALPAQIALGRISQKNDFDEPTGYNALGRLGQFVGGKASPIGRLGLNMATGERYDGESSKPFDLFTAEGAKVTAKDMFTPLAVQQALQDPSDMSHVVATMLGMDSVPKTKAKRVTAAPPMREGVIKNTIKSYNAGREKVKSRLKRGG